MLQIHYILHLNVMGESQVKKKKILSKQSAYALLSEEITHLVHIKHKAVGKEPVWKSEGLSSIINSMATLFTL